MGTDTLRRGSAYTGGASALCGKKAESRGPGGFIELVSEPLI